MLGIDKARDRSSDYACKQQQGDTWPSRPPGDPLRADTKHAVQRDCDVLLFHPAFPPIARAAISTRTPSPLPTPPPPPPPPTPPPPPSPPPPPPPLPPPPSPPSHTPSPPPTTHTPPP